MSSMGDLCETRRNNLDFIRFFLASLVIFSHSYLLLSPNGNEIEPFSKLTRMKDNFGSLAVACFFAISGFLIAQSWQTTSSLRDFTVKRLLRVYPGWIVALLASVFIAAPILRPSFDLSLGSPETLDIFGQLVLHDTGLFKLLPGVGLVNGSLWTIPFEIMCYGLLAVIGLGRVDEVDSQIT